MFPLGCGWVYCAHPGSSERRRRAADGEDSAAVRGGPEYSHAEEEIGTKDRLSEPELKPSPCLDGPQCAAKKFCLQPAEGRLPGGRSEADGGGGEARHRGSPTATGRARGKREDELDGEGRHEEECARSLDRIHRQADEEAVLLQHRDPQVHLRKAQGIQTRQKEAGERSYLWDAFLSLKSLDQSTQSKV